MKSGAPGNRILAAMTRRGEEEDEEKISDIADFLRREKPRSLDRTGFCIPGASREDGLQAPER